MAGGVNAIQLSALQSSVDTSAACGSPTNDDFDSSIASTASNSHDYEDETTTASYDEQSLFVIPREPTDGALPSMKHPTLMELENRVFESTALNLPTVSGTTPRRNPNMKSKQRVIAAIDDVMSLIGDLDCL